MKKYIVALCLLSGQLLQAQSLSPGAFASIAGYYSNANAQLEFNVGESVIGTFVNSNVMMTNGTLQPEFLATTIPTTQLRAIDCGKLNLSPDAQIAAIPIPGATLYHFEFKEATTGNFYGQRITTNVVISPSMVLPALLWNQQYLVRIKVFVNGQWGEFGASCMIGLMQDPAIAGISLTEIRTQYCNTPSSSIASTIVCNPVTMANRYEFKFTNSQNGNVHFYQSLTTACPLSTVAPSLIVGANYQVQVRARVYTTWGNFGSNCSVNTVAPQVANREEIGSDEHEVESVQLNDANTVIKKLSSYPNPFNAHTNLLFESSFNEEVIFKIFNLQGQLFHTFIGLTNVPEQLICELKAGSYMVIAITNSGLQHQTKILKVN